MLLSSAINIGFSDILLSFFGDRRQVVKIGNFISKVIKVCFGVLRDGHFSPLLFNLFINDLKNVLKYCEFLMFADDLKLFSIIVNESIFKKRFDLIAFLNGVRVIY